MDSRVKHGNDTFFSGLKFMQPVFFPFHCTKSIYTFHQVHCNPATDETWP